MEELKSTALKGCWKRFGLKQLMPSSNPQLTGQLINNRLNVKPVWRQPNGYLTSPHLTAFLKP